MMKFISILAFLLFGSFFGSEIAAGTNYWMMTDLGSSAKMIGYGGVEGFGTGADTVFENPAGLYRIQNNSIGLFTTTIIGEISYFNGSMAARTPWGVFGFGYMHASVEDVPHTAEDNLGRFFSQYSFDYKNTIVRGSYQYSIDKKWHLGASLSQYNNTFDGVSGIGYDLDFGVVYDTALYQVAGLIRNVMSNDVDYGSDGKETLGRQYTLSGKITPLPQVDILGQVKYAYDQNALSLGAIYKPTLLPFLNVSAGVKQFVTLDAVDNTYVFGFTLDFSDVEFHYTYEKSEHVEYDNKNYFSVSAKF
jgi:hypothetical protein